ncbi:hypothetical protein P4O66_019394 [Electrophorus voltai]|uniref:Fork-head domain-containing protein n=1 Tax=Electrophorus voltai TaxID=2609070 RepID=A0AAD8ZTM4_9TELE|nr:hypothetical protein P4O66_019394 [Electrophorus voltai]
MTKTERVLRSKGVQRRKYKRNTKGTYIGLLASIIQDSPNKMLTFRQSIFYIFFLHLQIMEKLGAFVSGDKKGLENNIRVCLSSNKCFAKVPIDPEYPNAKRNFWRVDESCITRKMLRRHFSNSVSMFPGLLPKRNTETRDAVDPGSSVYHRNVTNRPVKFSSSFSIESLLKKDHITVRESSYQPTVPEQGPNLYVLTFPLNRGVCWSGQFYGVPQTMFRMKYLDDEYQQQNFINPCSICNSKSKTTVDGMWKCPLKTMDLSAEHNRVICPPHWSYSETLSRPSASSPLHPYDRSYLRW